MLKLITAKTSIFLPGGIIRKAQDTFMCDSSFANKLIAAGNAIEAQKNIESSNEDDFYQKMTAEEAIVYAISNKTIKQLESIAESNGIELDKSLTKKDDIFKEVKDWLVKVYAEKNI